MKAKKTSSKNTCCAEDAFLEKEYDNLKKILGSWENSCNRYYSEEVREYEKRVKAKQDQLEKEISDGKRILNQKIEKMNKEKNKIITIKENILKMKNKVKEYEKKVLKNLDDQKKKIQEELKERIENVEKMEELIKKTEIPGNEIIGLNVGGKIFQTSSLTLKTKVKGFPDENKKVPHFFSAIASQRCGLTKDKNGNIFIDRDPKTIPFILDYLRDGGNVEKLIIPEDGTLRKKLIRDTEFYSLIHFCFFLKRGSFDSKILSEDHKKFLIEISGEKNWKLLYRGSRDGFGAKDFHNFCDGKPQTLTIIKTSNGEIIGAYNNDVYSSEDGTQKQVTGCYLFTLNDKHVTRPIGNSSVIHNTGNYGPFFGGNGNGSYYLTVINNCNSKNGSYYYKNSQRKICFSHAYETINFTVSEIEVFQKI